MKLVYRRDVIRAVRESWLRQYQYRPADEVPTWAQKRTIGDIRAAIKALDLETCSPSDIDKALGTKGWASHTCDECSADLEVLIRFGSDPDYDARWQDLCAVCLDEGIALMARPSTSNDRT